MAAEDDWEPTNMSGGPEGKLHVMVFKGPKGRKERYIGFFVPLNATTILLMSNTYSHSGEDGHLELELLRMG
ncbi:hypothetical protein M3Y99_00148300 [Aphelenchoides fujianensis]|nr:hypothetical protein M3Y99_00148300 [Aphelenchoides fujianensis]